MCPINKIVDLFFKSFEVLTFEENHDELTYKVRSQTLDIPYKDDFISACKTIPNRDELTLMVIIDNGDPISYNIKRPTELDHFFDELSDAKDIFDKETIVVIKIEIFKELIENALSIYFFEEIISTWKKYSIKNFWYCFGIILKNQFVNFEVMEKIKPFHTSNISFSTINTTYLHRIEESNYTNRIPLVEKMTENCHFANSSECRLIPNDFHLLEQSENKDLNELFLRFSLIQSLIYLFDITSKEKDRELYYKIRGYRQVSGTIDLDELKTDSATEYFKIFSWVYNGGNLSDKIGLARNILTIHFRKNNPLFLADDVLSSIKSGYDIYLKQNIDQYISTKKQVAKNIQEINARTNQIVESITVPFRNSFLGIITFFASMCIIRISLTQSLDRIFTKELSILSLSLIGLSLIYLLFLNREVEIDKKRFTRSYRNLKTRYRDILDHHDIENIFNHDEDYKANVDYIDEKKKRYSWIWLAIHMLLAIVVVVLLAVGENHPPKQAGKKTLDKVQIGTQKSNIQSPESSPQKVNKDIQAQDQSAPMNGSEKNPSPRELKTPKKKSGLQIKTQESK